MSISLIFQVHLVTRTKLPKLEKERTLFPEKIACVMSEKKPQLLLLGATGYIAGVLLSQWHVNGFDHMPFEVTASGRSDARLEKITKLLGIPSVKLSFDDTQTLRRKSRSMTLLCNWLIVMLSKQHKQYCVVWRHDIE